MNREEIVAYAAARAEAPEQSGLFWLSPPDSNQGEEDYCDECIGIIAALPTLVFCHLNLLRGESIVPAGHKYTDEGGSHGKRCLICDIWERSADLAPCWDAARQAIEWNAAATDGGWTGESDGWRSCENCGKELYVNLTEHAVSEEISHWKHYGPPIGGHDWWEFSEMVERAEDKHWKTIEELFTKWGLS